ncbi:sulfhydryl oxidase 1 [Antechinus flavipes]|uniref:sulfhydryl oxidase 1 n=1 Tax=Antechinus flavipes TaxID=38775 RepID=UPI002235F6AA|nr:sulfhydryl oxidase 1 [Antechinus flavipes]
MGRRGRCSAATMGPDSGSGAFRRPLVLLLLAALLVPEADAARLRAMLYSAQDPLVLLTDSSLKSTVLGSPSSWVVEFFASWCGHCIAFAPKWKALANEVKDWRPVLSVAALDCADEANSEICRDFGIMAYPTVKYFKAFSDSSSLGTEFSVSGKTVEELQASLIDALETHRGGRWPPSCPPLSPIRRDEINSFFLRNNDDYLAVIFEKKDSYLGREVELDLSQYHGIKVRRALDVQEDLVKKFAVTNFPSCYLLSRNGSSFRVPVLMESRSLYSTYLQKLPGVGKKSLTPTVHPNTSERIAPPVIKPVDRSKIYMLDLESTLHYILRIEVGKFKVLEGERLTALKNFVSVLAKYYPGQPMVRNFLHTIDVWLHWQQRKSVPYSSLEVALNSWKEGVLLPKKSVWVGCQGSEAHFRGFPCGLWILFHSLTVQAAQRNEYLQQKADPQEVLQAIRGYVKFFFGCRECATHFEQMAAASMYRVKSMDDAVLWFWNRHNRVNARLAGTASEDPQFPKIQWPPRELCNPCHNEVQGDPVWNLGAILKFFKNHFALRNIVVTSRNPSVEALPGPGRLPEELENFTAPPPVEQPRPTQSPGEQPADEWGGDLRAGEENEVSEDLLTWLMEDDVPNMGKVVISTERPKYYGIQKPNVEEMMVKELLKKRLVKNPDAPNGEALDGKAKSLISDDGDQPLVVDDRDRALLLGIEVQPPIQYSRAESLDEDAQPLIQYGGAESPMLGHGFAELFPKPQIAQKLTKRDTLTQQLEEGAGKVKQLASFHERKESARR